MDIFVGSIPFKLKEKELQEIFEKYGKVNKVTIIIDNITRQNKGFGFVEMPDDDEAKKAMEALNGSELDGRSIVVNKSGENKTSGGGNRSSSSNNSSTGNNGAPKKNFGEDKRKGGSGNFKGGFNKGGNKGGGGPNKGGLNRENKKGGGGSKKY